MSKKLIGVVSPFPTKEGNAVTFSALAGYTETLLRSMGLENSSKFLILAQRNTDKKEYVENVEGFSVSYVWRYNSPIFFIDILVEILRLKLKIVHVQHEVFVFGKKQYIYPYLYILLQILLKIFGVKIITTIHGVVPSNSIDKDFSKSNKVVAPLKLIKFGLKLMYKSTCKFSNYIIVHNEKLKKLLISNYGVEKSKIFVIPHPLYKYESSGLCPDVFKNIPKNGKTVLFFGFLAPYKGLDVLIKAAVSKEMMDKNNIFFLIAGSTPKRYAGDEPYNSWLSGLKSMSLRNKNILWHHDYVSDDNVGEYFKRSDLVVIPYSEAMSASGPLSIAVYQGKCVLVSEPFRGVVQEDLIYGSSDNDLSTSIAKYFSNRSYRLKISTAIMRQKCMWSDSVIAENMEHVYRELLG